MTLQEWSEGLRDVGKNVKISGLNSDFLLYFWSITVTRENQKIV